MLKQLVKLKRRRLNSFMLRIFILFSLNPNLPGWYHNNNQWSEKSPVIGGLRKIELIAYKIQVL
jgi:hypothetical protein